MTDRRVNCGTAVMTMCRGILATVELARPGAAAALARAPADQGPTSGVIRFLGARQLAQALATVAQPTSIVLASGAVVDGLHASSMIGLAISKRTWRRAAVTEAILAAGLGLASAVQSRSARVGP